MKMIFPNPDWNAIAKSLLQINPRLILENLQKMDGIDNDLVIQELLKAKDSGIIYEYSDALKPLTPDTADLLIQKRHFAFVAQYPENFTTIYTETYEDIVEAEQGDLFIKNFKKYPPIEQNRLVKMLIDGGWRLGQIENITTFNDLSSESVLMLICTGHPELFDLYLEKMPNSQSFEAMTLVENGCTKSVLGHIDKFYIYDEEQFVFQVIKFSDTEHIKKALALYSEYSTELAKKLIEIGCIDLVTNNLSKFKGLGFTTAAMLLKSAHTEFVVKNLSSFEGFDRPGALNKLAQYLIRMGKFYEVAHNLAFFKDLDNQVAKSLIYQGYAQQVRDNPASFTTLDF